MFRSEILLPSALGSAARLSQNGLLETKPVTRYATLLVLVSEPQILNLTRTALRQNFAKILLAAETMYFRRDEIHRPALLNRRRLNSARSALLKFHQAHAVCTACAALRKICRAMGSAIQISPAVSEVPLAR